MRQQGTEQALRLQLVFQQGDMSPQLWGQRSPRGIRYLSPALGTSCFLLADESSRPGKGGAGRKDTCIQVIPLLCHSTQHPWIPQLGLAWC